MNRKHLLAVLLLFLLCCSLNAQKDSMHVIKGRILMADSDQVLPVVNIFNLSTQEGTISDANGEFELNVKSWPVHLQFSHIGYESLALWLENAGDKWLDIQLHPYFTNLPDIVVSAQPIIKTITKATYTVRDYVFVGDNLLMATLPGMARGNALVLIDEDGNTLDSMSIKDIRHFDFLHKSCTDKIHLITANKSYEIAVDSNRIYIVNPTSRREFSRVVEPCVAATDSLLVYRYRYCIGQLLRFRAFAKYEDRDFLIVEVANDDNLERRYQEELASSVGYIDRMNVSWEEKQAELNRVLESDIKLAGLIHLFYQPIKVPLLSIGQQMVLFNHLTGELQCYDFDGAAINTIPVNYHKEKKWEDLILLDERTQNVYTMFDHRKGKVLRQINIENGTLGPPILIDCALVEQVKVNNGNLYYLESGAKIEAYNRVLRKVKL